MVNPDVVDVYTS